MNKTLKNITYVAGQQFVNTVLPFLTIPYIARVLGIEQNGIYSYTLTIVNLFAVFFCFGFAVHGVNTIAQSKKNLQKINYLEIQVLQISFLFLGILIFLFFVTVYPVKVNKAILILQGLILLVNFFDNSWYYQGIGDFKKIVTRNVIVKLVGTLSVFVFVKDPKDLWLYITLVNGSQLLGNILLFHKTLHLFKYFKLIQIKRLVSHVKVSFFLFLPNISVLIFSSFDKILLGSSGNITDLANYQQVQRIIAFAYSLLMIPSPVMIQKIASLRSVSQNKEADSVVRFGLNMYIILGSFFIFGVVLCSKEFIYLFLGAEYHGAINLFIIMSPILIIKTVGGVIGGWYLVPLGRNVLHSIPLLVGTCVSVSLNILITPLLGVNASAVILVLTELTVVIIQFLYSRQLYYFFDKKRILIFISIFSCSFLVLNLLSELIFVDRLDSIFLKLIINSVIFVFFSFCMSYLIKSTRLFLKDTVNLLKER
ncbi:oligosaccharide flippase family protein [Ectobacillus antri]|uniref:oligosaccharide flippase family protein n=1 Tax=Ectobacillus antri TaxID=2486280 RepID=UPI0013DE34B2|nr:oligosaccharide flippase family protein [Ectobacillus antri]